MPRPARILILTGSHLCRNPRVVKEASALGAAGHEVTVVGVRSHRSSVPLDADIVARTGLFRHENVELLEGPVALLRRARTRLARELVARAGWQLPAALGPAPALLHAARSRSFDLLIAHTEPALWAAMRLLAGGHLVAADLEDWHSEDLLRSARSSRPLRLLRQIEQTLLQRASFVTTTSQALADALHERYGGNRAAVLHNAFPLSPTPPTRRVSTAGPAFLWVSQTLGPGRGLEPFLNAWSLTRLPSRLVLVADPVADFPATLLNLLPATHRSRVNFLPPVPPAELPALIARHDIGLALEPDTPPNKNLTISNKLFHYLDAGLAVIATPTAGQREVLMSAPGAGLFEDFAHPIETAARLDALLGDPPRLAAMRAAARAAAETSLCWERHSPRLLEFVDRALARNCGPQDHCR